MSYVRENGERIVLLNKVVRLIINFIQHRNSFVEPRHFNKRRRSNLGINSFLKAK